MNDLDRMEEHYKQRKKARPKQLSFCKRGLGKAID